MLVCGYTTRQHLLLDLDETSQDRAVALARLIMESYPDVGDCLVLESSTPSVKSCLKYDDNGVPHERWVYQNFHLVFDAPVGWARCVHIIETLWALGCLNPEYMDIRQFRGDMTLRTSPKQLHHRTIPAPKPIQHLLNANQPFSYGNIRKYREFLDMTKSLGLT